MRTQLVEAKVPQGPFAPAMVIEMPPFRGKYFKSSPHHDPLKDLSGMPYGWLGKNVDGMIPGSEIIVIGRHDKGFARSEIV